MDNDKFLYDKLYDQYKSECKADRKKKRIDLYEKIAKYALIGGACVAISYSIGFNRGQNLNETRHYQAGYEKGLQAGEAVGVGRGERRVLASQRIRVRYNNFGSPTFIVEYAGNTYKYE